VDELSFICRLAYRGHKKLVRLDWRGEFALLKLFHVGQGGSKQFDKSLEDIDIYPPLDLRVPDHQTKLGMLSRVANLNIGAGAV
jgi:hypothetical protein